MGKQVSDADSGRLRLGVHLEADGEQGARTDKPLTLAREDLTTHGVIVGMTGSGKTGLGVVLLEEVLRQGVPALILDPKGDMGNLLLGFPELRAEDFAPWVDPGAQRGLSVEALAEQTAARWTKGLAGSGLSGEDIRALHDTVDMRLWTPGSTAGRPVNVVGSLAAPDVPFDSDAEGLRAEIESFVSSLLLLADIDADPISSREHILLCHLIERSWRAGQDLDLGLLIGQVAQPPIRRLGVFELDAFFPKRARDKLAMRLNGLVASPSFGSWMAGPPLEIETLLFTPEGCPRASVVYLPHLDEEQRQFVVTLLLSKVVTWMRRQPGTSDLRALIYMDEVYGFAPPTRNPPSKKPILTLLKQARAHGVGLVLATQNPVDLDYKAMSNAGTWVIGRLSTERDKARIVEALKSAAGDSDVERLDTLIGGLGKRQFVLHGARRPEPAWFTTRWAMSFLRGPLTREEVSRLCADDATPEGASTVDAQPSPLSQASQASQASLASQPVTSARPDGAGGHHGASTPLRTATVLPAAPRRRPPLRFPAVAPGVPVHHLDPAAPWSRDLGVVVGGSRWEAALVARVELRFPPLPAGGEPLVEVWETVHYPLRESFVAEAGLAVDWDPRDLEGAAPTSGVVRAPDAPIASGAWWDEARVALQRWLDASRTVTVLRNEGLGLVGRIGEDRRVFEARCRHAAEDRADAEAAERTRVYTSKMQTWRAQLEATTYKIDQAEATAAAAVATAARLEDEATLLAATLKGHMRARDVAEAVAKREAAEAKAERARAARARVDKAWADLAALEQQLGEELSEIHRRWLDVALTIEESTVERRAEVVVAHLGLLWMPMAEAGS